MGRGTSGVLPAATWDSGGPPDSDERLVAAVRRGDDRAFELLYERYQRRIHAYALGMVKDHGRAEDVTQEVFVSALRRMRETRQPLAFKPWLYQIAKNSCIDAFRRAKRAEEVSYDSDDALAPGDHSKLVGSGPSPDAAVAAKQDLDNLCGAFGGLSETHHEILVLRELEGLSYQQIGERMGMSPPAVESTLFRARRRLTEEYDDIVSGARCERVQGIILTASHSQLGVRDSRRLARHLSYCQACRRSALDAGLNRERVARGTLRERVASRIAGLLPFPALVKFRRGAADAGALPPSGRGSQWASQLPLFSDHLSSGWGKAAAGAAILVAGAGAGAGVKQVAALSASSDRPAEVRSARVAATPEPATSADSGPSAAGRPRSELSSASTTREQGASGGTRKVKREKRRTTQRPNQDRGSGGAPRNNPGGGGPEQSGAPDSNPDASSEPARDAEPSSTKPAAKRPGGGGDSTPAAVPTASETVEQTAGTLDQTVDNTTDTLEQTVQNTTGDVDDVVEGVTGGGAVSGAVDQVTDAVDQTVATVGQTLDNAVQSVTGAVGGLGGRRGG